MDFYDQTKILVSKIMYFCIVPSSSFKGVRTNFFMIKIWRNTFPNYLLLTSCKNTFWSRPCYNNIVSRIHRDSIFENDAQIRHVYIVHVP